MDFRRWFTALAVVALFAGLASAQLPGGGSNTFACNSVAQVTPQLRAEGVTELVGDIQISCTGGTALADGTAIPQANITVSLTAPVTSRLLNQPAPAAVTNQSEALLLIDEPGSAITPVVPGWGPAAAQTVCTTPLSGCVQYARTQAVGGVNYVTQSSSNSAAAAPINVYQGIVVGTNQVQFLGVPILPPGTTGVSRMFRITNIRVNASAAGSSIVGGVQQVQALISTSNPQALPISAVGGNAAVTVGYVQPSLQTGVSPIGTQFTQCNRNFGSIIAGPDALGQTGTRSDIVTLAAGILSQPANVAILNFRELFPSAFKIRGTTSQNVPGTQYNTESGLVINALTNGLSGNDQRIAGYANSPTRFQAAFAGLPAGTTIYVTSRNITQNTSFPNVWTTATSADASYATFNSGSPFGVGDVNAYNYTVPVVPATDPPTTRNALVVRQLSVGSNGTATAVWDVVNTLPNQAENFMFGILIAYTPNAALTQPAITSGTASVTLSYSPLEPSSNIPRFINTSTAQTGWLTIVPCQTVLLFPYVTSRDGFDTGLAISNTAQDPLGTQTATGSCTLNFYGQNAPTAAVSFGDPLGPVNTTATPNILPTRARLASELAPNFAGYAFAVCDFQFAHGFAFVSDVGARNLAMGYLALVVNNGQSLNSRGRTVAGEALGN